MKSFDQFLIESHQEFVGIHYSHTPDLMQLAGSNYGTGIRGAESDRISQSSDPRIKNRVYFYKKPQTGYPQRETGLGAHAYEFHSTNMYNTTVHNPHTDAIRKTQKSYVDRGENLHNAFESAVIDHGFHGYHNDAIGVVLNQSPRVKYLGQLYNGQPKKKEQPHTMSSAPVNAYGEQESAMLSPQHMRHWYQHSKELTTASPSARLQYGRLVAKQNDVAQLQHHFAKENLIL
jgi:hypothetical protein